MDHEAALELLDDFVEGQLDEDQKVATESHVAGCPECKAQLELLHLLHRKEVAALGDALFEPHPSAEQLVTYVLDPGELSRADQAALGRHLAVCPTCRVEADLTRRSNRHANSWWRRLSYLLPSLTIERIQPVLVPAMAALLVVLAYPSYVGLVKLPEAMRERKRLEQEAKLLQGAGNGAGRGHWLYGPETVTNNQVRVPWTSPDQVRTITQWAGPAQPLELPKQLRGRAPEGPAEGPLVKVRTGQPVLQVIADCELPLGGTRPLDREVLVRILSVPGNKEVWMVRASARDLWDATAQRASFMVPTSAVPAGSYRLEMRETADRAVLYAAPFRTEIIQTLAAPAGVRGTPSRDSAAQ